MRKLIQRWGDWAAKLRAKHTRTVSSFGARMTVLQRSLPVCLTQVALHRACSVLVLPRVSVTLRTAAEGTRVIETREQNRTVLFERAPAHVLVQQTPAAPQEAAQTAAAVSTTRRSFVNRSLAMEEQTHLRRRSRIVDEQNVDVYSHKNSFTHALEHAAMLRQRLQREETTMAFLVRQIRQQVVKSRTEHRGPDNGTATGFELSRGSSKQPQPAPPSLDSITDHVIQQIDRKLVAHRERMGRF